MGRDGSVGIQTRYGLGGPGNEVLVLAERSKAWVCGRSLAGVAGSNPVGGMDVCVVCVVRKRTKRKTGTIRIKTYR